MKKLYFIMCALFATMLYSQNTINSDATNNWIGWMSWFEKITGTYVNGSGWDVPALKTEVDATANTITLKPNYNTYNATDAYWTDAATGEGNKIMEANTYYEPGATFNGSDLTFTGNVVANTLNSDYTAVVFIKALDPNNGYATVVNINQPLPASGTFTLKATAAELAPGLIVQVGYTIKGLNANPANEATLGSVVVGPALLGTSEVVAKNKLNFYPNPVSQGEIVKISSKVQSVEVYNLVGQKVKESKQNSFNTQGLAKGIYVVKAVTENGTQTSKLIVK